MELFVGCRNGLDERVSNDDLADIDVRSTWRIGD
jgi:hypothetical protein